MVVVIFVLEIVAGILAFVFRSDVSIYASDIFRYYQWFLLNK